MPYFHTLTDCIEHTVDAWHLTSIHTETVLSPQWIPDSLLPYTQRLYCTHSGCLIPYFHTHTHRLYWACSGCLIPYFHTHTDCIEHTVDAWCLTSIHSQTVLSTQWMPYNLLPHTERLYWTHSGWLMPYFHTFTDCIEYTVDAWQLISIHTQTVLHTVDAWHLTATHRETILNTQWLTDALLPYIHRLYWAYSGCLTPYFHTHTETIKHAVDAWCLTSTHS